MPALILKILAVVFPVFSIIGLGYVFARFKKLSLEPVIEILLYLTIPALVVSSLTKKRLVTADLATVAIAALAVVLGVGLVAFLYLKIVKRSDLRGFYLPTMFMNSGNMSFPLALLAFGADGLAVAVIYYIAISLLVYTIGIYIAKGKGGVSEIFKLPLIYASAAGIALNLLDVRLPSPVVSTVDMLGAATIPIMQVSLGYRLHSSSFTEPMLSVAGAVMRIAGGFVIAYLVTIALGIDGLNQKIIILSSSMPSAVINFVISHKYKLHSDLVSSVVITSTILSIITTPIVLMLIMD